MSHAASDSTDATPQVQIPAGAPPMTFGAAFGSLVTAALWGGTPVAVSFSQDQFPPVFTAGVRFAQAAVFMLFWCRWEGCDLRLKRGQILPSWILGALLFGQIALFHVAIKWSSTSHATVLINTFVFWVAAIEHFVTRTERLSPIQGLGLVFAAIGGGVIFAAQSRSGTSRDAASLAGDLAMCASAVFLAVKVVYTKWAIRKVPSGTLMFWHDVFGVMLFFAWSAAFETVPWRMPSWPAAAGLFYQGVLVAGFCFALQAWLLRTYSASQVSIYSVSTPLFGLYFSWVFRGDELSPWLVVSAVCVAVGIALVNRRPTARGTESSRVGEVEGS
ncbi:MAG: DMT family transporter [Planctomycetaceae bacterium]|nr:DMT family transporter [Planctomycetaceae bacterium]